MDDFSCKPTRLVVNTAVQALNKHCNVHFDTTTFTHRVRSCSHVAVLICSREANASDNAVCKFECSAGSENSLNVLTSCDSDATTAGKDEDSEGVASASAKKACMISECTPCAVYWICERSMSQLKAKCTNKHTSSSRLGCNLAFWLTLNTPTTKSPTTKREPSNTVFNFG